MADPQNQKRQPGDGPDAAGDESAASLRQRAAMLRNKAEAARGRQTLTRDEPHAATSVEAPQANVRSRSAVVDENDDSSFGASEGTGVWGTGASRIVSDSGRQLLQTGSPAAAAGQPANQGSGRGAGRARTTGTGAPSSAGANARAAASVTGNFTGAHATASGSWAAAGLEREPSNEPPVVHAELVPRGRIDVLLLAVVAALVTIGLMSVYSGSALGAYFDSRDGRDDIYLVRQIGVAVLGLVALGVGLRVDYGWYWRWRYWILISSYVMLALVLVPGIGVEVNNSRRWLNLIVFRFQPAEFAKLAAVLYFAYSITKKREGISSALQSIGFHSAIASIFVGLLMLQPDMGSSVIISMMLILMLFVGGAPMSFLSGLGVLGIVLVIAGISGGGYRSRRIAAWLEPWEHQATEGYQLVNSYVALASGGMDGVGLGEGRGRLGYIPEMYNDFIASGIGEEFGLWGIAALCILYLLFFWRGMRIALDSRDRFGFMLAFGITMLVTFQAAFNLSVVTGLLPTKGLTLPFISYGRTSLIMLLFAVGVLLNIGQRNPDLWREEHIRRRQANSSQRQSAKRKRVADARRARALRTVGEPRE
jgi:cell division protein FtsW